MKNKNISQGIVTKIKSWEGFEGFDGTNIEFCDEYENTALMRAAVKEDIDVVKTLIQAGANVNAINEFERSPLLMCSLENHISVKIANELINAGANVNYIEKDDDFSFSLLMRACLEGQYEFVKTLLKLGADVNLSQNDGQTAIGMVGSDSEYYIDILETLIKAGADVNTYGGSALQCAIYRSKFDAIKMLVNAGAKMDIPSADIPHDKGRTACMSFLDGQAVDLEEEEIEEIFLLFCKHIGDVNVQDNEGKSLIFYALDTYIGGDDFDLRVLDTILFNKNLNINLRDKSQNTALSTLLLAIEKDVSSSTHISTDEELIAILDEDILKGLLEDNKLKELRRKFEEEGYTINKLNDDEKNTLRQKINEISSSVTHELADHERYKIESLLIIGCNVEYKNADGDTPEIIAKRINSEEILSLLKNADKLINAEDRMGTTPLMVAALQGHTEKARWLIKKGAYINTKNKCHQIFRGMELYGTVVPMSEETTKPKLLTALMVARNIDTVKALILAGADINVQAADGKTALMLYTKDNWLEGVEWLIYAGADANITNKRFETALIIAKRVGVYDRIITLLEQNTVKKVVPSILSTLFRFFIR